jgi:heme-degrading monooxygenase HmoA
MIAVIFEFEPDPEGRARYFELAGQLRGELEGVDGFLSVERFQSVTDEGRFVSLSFWRDQAAVEAWYAHAGHRAAQDEGRGALFRRYRIRVAEVVRDYDQTSGRPAMPEGGTR